MKPHLDLVLQDKWLERIAVTTSKIQKRLKIPFSCDDLQVSEMMQHIY